MTDHLAEAEHWATEARQTGGVQGVTYALTALVHLGIAYLQKEQT